MWWEAITIITATDPLPTTSATSTTAMAVPATAAESTAPTSTTAPPTTVTFRIPCDLLFDPGSAEIDEAGRATLLALVEEHGLESAVRIVIIGHTDGEGSEPYNDELGLARANAGRDVISIRVDPSVIATETRGEREPIADEKGHDPDAARALNRRIELVVTMAQ